MLTITLLLFPILVALLVLIAGDKNAKAIASLGAFIELVLGAYVFSIFKTNSSIQFEKSYVWINHLGINFSFGIDGISMVLVALTTLLVPFIILSSVGNQYSKPSVFYALILSMQAALIGVFTAQDIFLFYFFFEAALLPIYFIAAKWGDENRIAVTIKFFIYTIFGSLFMLLAIVYLYLLTPGTHSAEITDIYEVAKNLDIKVQTTLFIAFFIAFAIKMPLFPFHTWQPDTYVSAPTSGTMLLSGIMLKMGVYGLIRLILPIVPLAVEKYGYIAIILSVIGIIYGSIIAIQQKDMKRLVAYSSFAHVGLMSAGIFSGTLDGVQGAIIQMLAHGINVVGLFFVIEIIQQRTKSRDLAHLGGITQQSKSLSIYFLIILLGSVALPLTNGFVGEFLLLKGLYQFNIYYGTIAGLTIILGAVYMLRMFQKSMLGITSKLTDPFKDLVLSEKIVLFSIAFLVISIGVLPNTFLAISEPAVSHLLNLIHK